MWHTGFRVRVPVNPLISPSLLNQSLIAPLGPSLIFFKRILRGDKIRRVYGLLFGSWFPREEKKRWGKAAIVRNVTIARRGWPLYT